MTGFTDSDMIVMTATGAEGLVEYRLKYNENKSF